ncbi:type IV secretion system protein [Plesiomonas shigelloides]|uniref:type IV secretion system protein n=1 Tax=Plesiomonas shigelloides TaxID=703 RepID=UPI0012624A05|nr:type IV secretion system protein [Plesiomonas shigelloides]KAB7693144.1 type IV secretion system protein VirB6 [Plesiomonas shigelloides]
MDITIFSYIGTSIDAATKSFILDGVGSLINSIKILVISGVTLYIMFKSYLQTIGKTDDLLRDTVTHCIIVICITGLSLNATNYTTYLIGGVNAFADGLASTISAAAGAGTGDRGTVFRTLDELLVRAIDQANTCFAKMSLWDSESWDWIFSAIAVLISIGAVTLLASVIIIGSKFLLTLLFLLGPLFLSAACFPATRRYFDSWVGKLMENCLVQVFGIAITTLLISIITNFIEINPLGQGDANPLAIAAQITILSGVMFYILRQIPNLAGSLSGGFASASMTLRDAINPAGKVAQATGYALGATGYAISSAATQARRADMQNQIQRGANASTASRAEMKREQMIKDMIAEQTRKNMSTADK